MNYQIWPTPGTIVFVFFAGKLRHYGILTDRWYDGKPTVVANAWATNGVREISWDRFRNRRQVFEATAPSALPPILALQNARRCIGIRYDLLSFNCEHFVQHCFGNAASSAQVGATVGALTLAALSVALIGMVSEI